MFGTKVAGTGGGLLGAMNLTGSANNCTMVPPEKWSGEHVMNYMQPDEKAMLLLKSQKDEYLFTTRGLIFSDGESAASPKRTVTRTNWAEADVNNVRLVTAGLVDLDVSIEFDFQIRWRIEMRKEEVVSASLVFRCLDAVSNRKINDRRLLEMETRAYKSNGTINCHLMPGADPAAFAEALTASSSKWASRMVETYMPWSYEKEFNSVLHR